MKPDLIMLHVVALSISLFGGGLLRWHRRQWTEQQQDPTLDPAERLFLEQRFLRRMKSSGILLVLGLLLNASNEFMIPWQRFQPLFYAYVALMLALISWMVLLAFSDLLATRLMHR